MLRYCVNIMMTMMKPFSGFVFAFLNGMLSETSSLLRQRSLHKCRVHISWSSPDSFGHVSFCSTGRASQQLCHCHRFGMANLFTDDDDGVVARDDTTTNVYDEWCNDVLLQKAECLSFSHKLCRSAGCCWTPFCVLVNEWSVCVYECMLWIKVFRRSVWFSYWLDIDISDMESRMFLCICCIEQKHQSHTRCASSSSSSSHLHNTEIFFCIVLMDISMNLIKTVFENSNIHSNNCVSHQFENIFRRITIDSVPSYSYTLSIFAINNLSRSEDPKLPIPLHIINNQHRIIFHRFEIDLSLSNHVHSSFKYEHGFTDAISTITHTKNTTNSPDVLHF